MKSGNVYQNILDHIKEYVILLLNAKATMETEIDKRYSYAR